MTTLPGSNQEVPEGWAKAKVIMTKLDEAAIKRMGFIINLNGVFEDIDIGETDGAGFRIASCMNDIFMTTVSRYCYLNALYLFHLEVQLDPFWVSVTKLTITCMGSFINEAEHHATICRHGASETDFTVTNLEWMVTEVKRYRESLVDLIRGKEGMSPESFNSTMSRIW